jgi:hypothetical protein
MSKLVIVVPTGRRTCGRAALLGGGGELRLVPFRVLATADGPAAARHGNPGRDWRRPFGDTPTGSYAIAGARDAALVLAPVSGNALEASRSARSRVLVEGGPPDESGRLRATLGGLRVSDADLARLLRAVEEASAGADPVSSVELEEISTPLWMEEPDARAAPPRAPKAVPRAALAALGFRAAHPRATRRRAAAVDEPGRSAFLTLAHLAFAAPRFSCSGPDGVGAGDEDGGAEAHRNDRRRPARFVLELLGGMRGGFFLDSGASDGVTKSNTQLLEASFGWRGICVEPNETFFRELVKNRACVCVSCCLYDREGDVELVEADVLSGILDEYHPSMLRLAQEMFHVPEGSPGRPATVRRPARTVRSLLRELGAPRVIDYWSLDTEGSELTILKSFPFDEFSFRVLTVEHNNLPAREGIRAHLESHGYVRIEELEIDDCYVKAGTPLGVWPDAVG